jgi:2C-methyl-D-erythritol 2,4-cyclodiphosphate synthase
MFISHELFTRLKADMDKDLVELTDGGKTLLINGKSLAIHLWGEVAERFHLLTKEAKDELYAKIKAEAVKLSNEAKAKIDAIDATIKAEEVKVAADIDKGIAAVASDVEKEASTVAVDATKEVDKVAVTTENVTVQVGTTVDTTVDTADAAVQSMK